MLDSVKNRVPPSAEGEGLRVLLAEDNSINALFMMTLLKKTGHRAVCVENGEEALKALENGEFDLVLMDIQMPVMNGEEAFKAIRERENLSSVPVIALTAYAMQSEHQRFIDIGFDGYISKPVQVDKLIAEIDRVMKR
ncbi:MAG: response regulator [Desulfuromonadaceae bacterium]|nr:response regulator [Desulfuromonadaceae bacterium]MDD2855060.1 response regulator [Desulfuromonadaceae bacterium]